LGGWNLSKIISHFFISLHDAAGTKITCPDAKKLILSGDTKSDQVAAMQL
jgi:hypothetical protein